MIDKTNTSQHKSNTHKTIYKSTQVQASMQQQQMLSNKI